MELLLVPAVLWFVTSFAPTSDAFSRIPICPPPSPTRCSFPYRALCAWDENQVATWFCSHWFTGKQYPAENRNRGSTPKIPGKPIISTTQHRNVSSVYVQLTETHYPQLDQQRKKTSDLPFFELNHFIHASGPEKTTAPNQPSTEKRQKQKAAPTVISLKMGEDSPARSRQTNEATNLQRPDLNTNPNVAPIKRLEYPANTGFYPKQTNPFQQNQAHWQIQKPSIYYRPSNVNVPLFNYDVLRGGRSGSGKSWRRLSATAKGRSKPK